MRNCIIYGKGTVKGMRVERNVVTDYLVFCKNGGCSHAVYECFRRVNSFGVDIDECDDCILVMSDYFDFDIILKIRDGYVYCEVHTDNNGNHSYTVVYSYEDVKRDIITKLNELIFNTAKYAELTLKEKRTICNCVYWYYFDMGEEIPNKPFGLQYSGEDYNIYSKTKAGIVASGSYLGEEYGSLLNITLWSMATMNTAISIMNWDEGNIALYANIDDKLVGVKPHTPADMVSCFCALIRLIIEVQTGYRKINIADDMFELVELESTEGVLDANGEIFTECLVEMGYDLDKYSEFEAIFKYVVNFMLLYEFTAEDFGAGITSDGEMVISKFFQLTGGEWV